MEQIVCAKCGRKKRLAGAGKKRDEAGDVGRKQIIHLQTTIRILDFTLRAIGNHLSVFPPFVVFILFYFTFY